MMSDKIMTSRNIIYYTVTIICQIVETGSEQIKVYFLNNIEGMCMEERQEIPQ